MRLHLVSIALFVTFVTEFSNSLPVSNESADLKAKSNSSSLNPLENVNLFLGDIKIKRLATGNTGSLQNGIVSDNDRWNVDYIPFEIDDELESALKLIYNALLVIQSKTCIRFKYRTDESDYIRYIYDDGCYSYVGHIGGAQEVSLGEGCWCQGTVIHETMHALGFYHEQNRSDRDEYITINYNNVMEGAESQFIKLSPKQNRLFTSYDYDSLMHYHDTAFSKSGDLKTMVPKQAGIELIHQCYKPFSPKDIEKINKLYNCTSYLK